MKKVLVGLLLIIPIIIVAAVMLVTEVVLLTPDISVESVSIVDPDYYQDVPSVSINFENQGMQYQLAVLITPRKANNKKVTWSIEHAESFDPDFEGDVATVDGNGMVTVYWPGTFDVVVRTDDGGKEDRCPFAVNSDVARSAFIVRDGNILKDNSIELYTDEIIKLDACARPIDVNLAYVRWESDNESVLRVDANGVLMPVSAGNANVTMRLKSVDFVQGGEVKKVAEEIVRSVNVNVKQGAFNCNSYNLCVKSPTTEEGVEPVEIPAEVLIKIGATASDFDAEKSKNAVTSDGRILFTDKTGSAVFTKNGKSISVNKYDSENAIAFENADKIANGTLIIGKVPLTLNCIYLRDGSRVDGVEYTSNHPEIADIDKNTGLITAKTPGEVRFTAKAQNGENAIEILLYVKNPVIYFMLGKDAFIGIGNERIYGNHRYDDSLTVVPTRQIYVMAPDTLVGQSNLFRWSVTSDDNVASIDENGLITFKDFEGEKTVKVTAEAIDSPYTSDLIKRSYSFVVRQGINVRSQKEIEDAAAKAEFDIFIQSNITLLSNAIYESTDGGTGLLKIRRNLYGNGHTVDWRPAPESYKNEKEKSELEQKGSNIFEVLGAEDETSEYLIFRNVRVRGAVLPEDGSIAKNTFDCIPVSLRGRVHAMYCIAENGKYCMRVYGFNGKSDMAVKNTIVEGCIFSNSSKFTFFSWCDTDNQHVVLKNCVFGQSAAPSVGFSTGNAEKHATLEFEGFTRIYNWKQKVDMDLIGDITSNAAINAAVKRIIDNELSKPKYQQYSIMDNGIQYMHCGMMFSGFECPDNISIIDNGVECMKDGTIIEGSVSKNKFGTFQVSLADIAGDALAPLFKDFYDITIMGYYGNEELLPVRHTETLVHSQNLYKMLREGDPLFDNAEEI